MSSFSAVSTPIFTIKYSLESSRRDLLASLCMKNELRENMGHVKIPHSTRDLKFQFFAKNPDSFGRFLAIFT